MAYVYKYFEVKSNGQTFELTLKGTNKYNRKELRNLILELTLMLHRTENPELYSNEPYNPR